MPGYGNYGFGMPFTFLDPLVELNDMTIRPTGLIDHDDVRRFNQSPLQIPVHIEPDFAEKASSSTRLDPWNSPRIARQMLGPRKSLHISDLHGQDYRQDRLHPGHRYQQRHGRCGRHHHLDLLLRRLDFLLQLIQ